MALYFKGINQVAEKRKKLFAFRRKLLGLILIDGATSEQYSSSIYLEKEIYISHKYKNDILIEHDFYVKTKTLSEILEVNPITVHRWARKNDIKSKPITNRSVQKSYSLNDFCNFFG